MDTISRLPRSYDIRHFGAVSRYHCAKWSHFFPNHLTNDWNLSWEYRPEWTGVIKVWVRFLLLIGYLAMWGQFPICDTEYRCVHEIYQLQLLILLSYSFSDGHMQWMCKKEYNANTYIKSINTNLMTHMDHTAIPALWPNQKHPYIPLHDTSSWVSADNTPQLPDNLQAVVSGSSPSQYNL